MRVSTCEFYITDPWQFSDHEERSSCFIPKKTLIHGRCAINEIPNAKRAVSPTRSLAYAKRPASHVFYWMRGLAIDYSTHIHCCLHSSCLDEVPAYEEAQEPRSVAAGAAPKTKLSSPFSHPLVEQFHGNMIILKVSENKDAVVASCTDTSNAVHIDANECTTFIATRCG